MTHAAWFEMRNTRNLVDHLFSERDCPVYSRILKRESTFSEELRAATGYETTFWDNYGDTAIYIGRHSENYCAESVEAIVRAINPLSKRDFVIPSESELQHMRKHLRKINTFLTCSGVSSIVGVAAIVSGGVDTAIEITGMAVLGLNFLYAFTAPGTIKYSSLEGKAYRDLTNAFTTCRQVDDILCDYMRMEHDRFEIANQ